MAKNKRKDVHFWVPLIVSVLVISGLAIAIYVASRPIDQATTCPVVGQAMNVKVSTSGVEPNSVHAERCDVLRITNGTGEIQELMFGSHNKMADYNGLDSHQIAPGESYDLRLERSGDYQYHFMPSMVGGSFSVESNR